eukprot:GEZU01004419.1.p1 GENE.GEZU01004419.1~~GEZU01004419.1.p1  ORF type:complete len:106 (+),score=7.54 GEZU01004419.1:55-372(+)
MRLDVINVISKRNFAIGHREIHNGDKMGRVHDATEIDRLLLESLCVSIESSFSSKEVLDPRVVWRGGLELTDISINELLWFGKVLCANNEIDKGLRVIGSLAQRV